MRQPIRTIALAAVCMTAGAANLVDAKPQKPAQAQPRTPSEVEDGNQCPYAMRGVKLTASLDKEGVVFEFTNPRKEYVKDVRLQLREAADLIQELSRLEPDEHKIDPDVPRLPPMAIVVKDIQSGARVVIHAVRAQDRAELRELAAGFAEFWEQSDCSVESDSVSV
ncbi:MAG: hypothetical protein SFX73_36830 [Kofleriaceae bacterium]|nr:hypothetical protein [Kofleriaceae bacterium]